MAIQEEQPIPNDSSPWVLHPEDGPLVERDLSAPPLRTRKRRGRIIAIGACLILLVGYAVALAMANVEMARARMAGLDIQPEDALRGHALHSKVSALPALINALRPFSGDLPTMTSFTEVAPLEAVLQWSRGQLHHRNHPLLSDRDAYAILQKYRPAFPALYALNNVEIIRAERDYSVYPGPPNSTYDSLGRAILLLNADGLTQSRAGHWKEAHDELVTAANLTRLSYMEPNPASARFCTHFQIVDLESATSLLGASDTNPIALDIVAEVLDRVGPPPDFQSSHAEQGLLANSLAEVGEKTALDSRGWPFADEGDNAFERRLPSLMWALPFTRQVNQILLLRFLRKQIEEADRHGEDILGLGRTLSDMELNRSGVANAVLGLGSQLRPYVGDEVETRIQALDFARVVAQALAAAKQHRATGRWPHSLPLDGLNAKDPSNNESLVFVEGPDGIAILSSGVTEVNTGFLVSTTRIMARVGKTPPDRAELTPPQRQDGPTPRQVPSEMMAHAAL